MDQLASLIRWIFVYAVNGGFWHFVACYLILRAITRIFSFVRVNATRTVEKKEEKKA